MYQKSIDHLTSLAASGSLANLQREGVAVEEKYNDLRMLITSRIQADGSKYMFKAKHLVDLPKDFYEKLEPHIFPKDS